MFIFVCVFVSCVLMLSLQPCGLLLGKCCPLVGYVDCVFVTFPRCILGQVWYLIVSFPDLFHLSYFVS